MDLIPFRRHVGRVCLRVLSVGIVGLARPRVQAQNTIPPDPENNGSNYMYPVHTWTPPESRAASVEEAAAFADRLQHVIVPEITFQQTRLANVIDFFCRESHRLDPELPRLKIAFPTRRIAPWSASPVPKVPVADQRISLALHNVPLLAALESVAAQVGLQAKVASGEVWFIERNRVGHDELVTRDFEISPDVLGFTPSQAKEMLPFFDPAPSGAASYMDTETILESKGITSPPGASAIYLLRVGKLYVRNTQENLDKIRALVDQSHSLTTPTPTPTNP